MNTEGFRQIESSEKHLTDIKLFRNIITCPSFDKMQKKKSTITDNCKNRNIFHFIFPNTVQA